MIGRSEIDGVPTLIAKTSGPPVAGLTFRVGTADETLARHGVTHLLEHLALYQFGLSDYHCNGATGELFTHFHTRGSLDDLVKFFAGVCAALGDPPFDRLEMEREILRTEENTWGASVMESFPLWRHGARDYGLASYSELGLAMLGPDEIRDWSRLYFAKANAVFWIAGELRLDLPDGERRPVPAPSSALPVTSAYFRGHASGSNAIGRDAIVRRGAAASVFSDVLERELFRVLRQEGGFPTPSPPTTARVAMTWRGSPHSPTRCRRSRTRFSVASSTSWPPCDSGASNSPR